MTDGTIKATVAECKRFMAAAQAALARIEAEHSDWQKPGERYVYRSRETAALRRVSLDLTIALAKMRSTAR